MNQLTANATPFLRWAGSKRKLLPKLRAHWPGAKGRYIEPFMGSACLFFDLKPHRAILSDVNVDLVETYRALKSRVHQLYDAVISIRQDEETYYAIRSMDRRSLPFVERAARFVYLNRFCFNGIYRTNSKGIFNVPYGGRKSGGIPSKQTFLNCSQSLKRANLFACDFETVVRANVKKNDFVYLDPPYAIANRRVHTQYDAHSFGLADLDRLATTIDLIDQKGAAFVLSYADCKEARTLFDRWPSKIVATQRNVAGFAIHRAKARELIVSNIGLN